MFKFKSTRGLSAAAVALSAALTMSIPAAEAAGRVAGRATVANPNGGVTSVGGAAVKGPNGGAGVRGRAVTTDGQGNAKWGQGAAVKGPNGGQAATAGSGQRNADGTYSGQRATQATDANGNTYTGSTTYNSQTGVVRQATCTNASGAVIPCPLQ